MGLNQTLDRLKAEREEREYQAEIAAINNKVSDLAERIFFQRMLKDINHGMGEEKIDAMIERSVMIATKLYNRLYK